MTWALVAAFALAGFFLGRGWQATKNDATREFYIDEIENCIDLICKQQQLIRDMRDALANTEAAWQADRDRLHQRGM